MGTSNSRLKTCQVAPSGSQRGEEHPSRPSVSPWMITTVLEHRPTCPLPPLKQNKPHVVHSLPGSQDLYTKRGHSIIKSHPPRQKAWQPDTPLKEPSMASDEHVSMRNTRGFLPAQNVLNYHATKKQRALQRHLREKQREQQRIYTSSIGGGGDEEIQRIQLVSRPTQRDIFWDETKGQHLDFRELLRLSKPATKPRVLEGTRRPPHPDNTAGFGANDRTLPQGNQGGFPRATRASVRSPGRGRTSPLQEPDYETRRKNLPWLQDFRTHEQISVNSHNVLEDRWGHELWLEPPRRGLGGEEGEKGADINTHVNAVHQKWTIDKG
ncbi:uncharacterized protein LOC143481285 [Brachyhypopomus gauderio]|uniref:uncharacterized protein LOC143481285 n=1 Tax=Brachyhypopomus gauderio TaxID=698409 RepID=UPI00404201A9